MNYFISINLNLFSLLALMVVPFICLLFYVKKFKLTGIIVMILVTILSVIIFCILVKSIVEIRFYGFTLYTLLLVMHVIPPIQSLFIVYLCKLKLDSEHYFQAADSSSNNHTIAHLTWDDVIISSSLRDELTSVISLLMSPEKVRKYGISVPRGILLSGPPGNGKTTVAKIIANISGLKFFAITSDKLISKWVGESEKYLSQVFSEAQACAPSIIFIDEIDTISRTRSEGGERWSENLLNHFLQLVDGIYSQEGVYIIGATNRPDLIDPALKRSGRLNKEINIPLPDTDSRKRLFDLYLTKMPLSSAINTIILADKTKNMSCSDISAICNQAGINAFKREKNNKTAEHFITVDDVVQSINDIITKKSLPKS